MPDTRQSFLDAMNQAGIPATHSLILDGKLRRYNVNGDKRGRKNGWYRFVEVNDSYAWGVFGSNKLGISEKWSSKERVEITAYEKKERKKQEAAIKKTEEEARGKAAIKANRLWAAAEGVNKHATGDNAPLSHDYATRKGIKPYGVRVLHTMLVIPIYADNYIVSLQFIARDGFKRYLTEGQKEGGYYWIGQETPEIWITEGYATACSVHEATGGHVVICFDAGNMPAVARTVRERNPGKKIIIAADNDQWTKGNPGYSKAQEAAALTGAEIKLPPFNPEDKSRLTDWNDYHAIFGLEALRAELTGAKPEPKKEIAKSENAWRALLLEGKEERAGYKPFNPKSRENAYLFLKNHELFANMLAYNVFTDQIMIMKCPPWDNPQEFTPREVNPDTDPFAAAKELERLGITAKNDDVFNCFRMLARESSINPPKDYFNSLQWDGKERLKDWLLYYLGADQQPLLYLSAIGKKWMAAAVKRVFEPGCKFDNILLLEGEQGIKKTSAFRVLSTFHNESYFLEFSGSIAGKDALMMMQGKLIVEMSELASIRRADQIEEVKSFITRQIDEYRPPYGRKVMKRKRFFILGATTNNRKEDGYFFDSTGNRRYWPVTCSAIDLDALERDKAQLWAEAVHLYKSGELVWLEDEEKELALLEQEGRQGEETWLEPVQDFLVGKTEVSVHQIIKGLSLDLDKSNTKNEKRIITCLRELGWKPTMKRPRTESGARITIWKKEQLL